MTLPALPFKDSTDPHLHLPPDVVPMILSKVLAAFMQGCEVFTPAVTRGFGLGQLETVLKAAMQTAGVEGQPSVLLIEDHHMITDDILETVNSLLSAGELSCALLSPRMLSIS